MAEKNYRSRIEYFSKQALSLRSGIIYGLFALLLAVALTGGMTNAWFTSGDHMENKFTAGTLVVEATNLNAEQTERWQVGDCLENRYNITNKGTKKMYVRASFEGFWKRLYHRNTATATTSYNGQTITDSDQARYIFGKYGPSYSSTFTPEASQGFFDESSPVPSLFPYLWSGSSASSSTGSTSSTSSSSITVISAYPDNCSGPLVAPVTGSALSVQYPDLFDNPALNDPEASKVKRYLGPQSCDQFYSFKINSDQSGIPNGATYTDSATGFTVTIYKKDISGKFYFAYRTNFPVYHIYAKGGKNGGNFYLYYPTYNKGVYQDCGLSQPGGDWSHITFYYCVPPAKPSIELVKQVSVDGGIKWLDADEAFGPELIDSQPKFRFWVANTGNVTLNNIVIEDNVFGYIGTIPSLASGASDGFIIDDKYWDKVLETGNVMISLCDGMDNWVKMGSYYYYLSPIESEQSVTLCVKVCLTDPTGAKYDGAQFALYSFFEAVQTTNGLVHQNWIPNPYQ